MFNITTIFTKMVLNYFEVVINYIIALTLHARRNNLMSFCSYQCSQWWYYNRHDFILDWLCVHSWTQTLCIKHGESDLHCPQLSSCHDIPPQFSSVKADWQQMWVRQNEFVCVVHVLLLTELSSSSLLNHIASPQNLPCEYCVAAPVWHFDQQRCDDPIMIQQLSLTSFFTNYKPNQTIQSFPCWNSYVWVLHCCITSLFMFCINDFTIFYWFH